MADPVRWLSGRDENNDGDKVSLCLTELFDCRICCRGLPLVHPRNLVVVRVAEECEGTQCWEVSTRFAPEWERVYFHGVRDMGLSALALAANDEYRIVMNQFDCENARILQCTASVMKRETEVELAH